MRTRRISALVVLSVCAIAQALAEPDSAHSWPGFRGPNGDGAYRGHLHASGMKDVAFRLEWKRKIGSGYSGVAVLGDRAVTAFCDGKNDILAAFHAKTGEELWRFELGPQYVGHDGAHNGPICTPLIAEGRVFMLDPRGRFVALDLATGAVAWEHDVKKEYGAREPFYAFGTSPFYAAGLVLLQIGAEDAAVVAFHPKSGEKKWSAGADAVNFQSMQRDATGGDDRVLATGQREMLRLDARTGAIDWRVEHNIPGRGAIALIPLIVDQDRLFLKGDDASGVVRRTGDGAACKLEQVWKDNGIRNSYNVPVLHDGHIYAYSTRFLTCVSLADGTVAWRSRFPGDGFLTLAGDQLVIITKDGSLHLVDASPKEYRERASLKLFDDLSWTNPSIADGRIFVRSLGEIACVSVQSAEKAGAPQVADAGDRGRMAKFLREVGAAPESDRSAIVDAFLAQVAEFPLIEGEDTVHFIYRGPGQGLAVAGDLFGARQEHAMTQVAGTDLFYCTAQVEPDARLSYLFMCDYKEIRDPRNPRTAESIVLGRDMEMSFGGGAPLPMSWFAMPRWKAPAYLQGEPVLTGKLETHELDLGPPASQPAGARPAPTKLPLVVYTPPGYAAGQTRYPVAYVHSGRAAIDRGALHQCADALIQAGRIQPLLLVFMDLPPSRDPKRGEQLFLERVIPFVDENYRTIASAEGRANIGMGLGALTALSTAFDARKVVGRIGVQSPMLFDGFRRAFEPAVPQAAEVPLTVYHDWGKYDLRNPHENWDMAAANRALARILSERGYQCSGGEVHDGTDWASWRTRGDRLLEALFPASSDS